ncbi:MAG: OB-fold nucleic acid binding domain-containing protein, partial [Planctomycetales bacterium]
MNRFMTHTCGELRPDHEGLEVRLSGWIHRIRDHGGVMFIDLRDCFPLGTDGDERWQTGLTQVVVRPSAECFEEVSQMKVESVVTFTGEVRRREEGEINPKLPTGSIEVVAKSMEVQSRVEFEENKGLPVPVADETPVPEATRLEHRFLDLRRARMHRNIMFRSEVISSIRRRMTSMDFVEFQTPILGKASPEGARDYLVPSRVNPGRFYALPQAPQQ